MTDSPACHAESSLIGALMRTIAQDDTQTWTTINDFLLIDRLRIADTDQRHLFADRVVNSFHTYQQQSRQEAPPTDDPPATQQENTAHEGSLPLPALVSLLTFLVSAQECGQGVDAPTRWHGSAGIAISYFVEEYINALI